MIKGIDLSHWQNDAGKIQWEKVRGAGYIFAFIKASQGETFKDPFYKINIEGARTAGILVGHYHFANPSDPIKEADFFCSVIGKPLPGEPVILDWEVPHADPVGWCKKWLERVEEKLSYKPIIYLNESTVIKYDWTPVAKGNFGLWAAKYGDNDTTPEPSETPNTDEWGFYAVWQFSSRGSVPGISGNVDLNICNFDSIETLKKYGAPAENTEEPKSKVTKELKTALKYAHDLDIGDFIDQKDQLVMAQKLMELKDSELSAKKKLLRIVEVINS